MATMNLEQLARIPALQGFTDDERAAFFQIATRHRFRPGEPIIKAGDQAYCFYLVANGQVELSVKHGMETVPVAQLGKGNLFGELPLVYHQSVQRANVKAVQSAALLRFNYTDYGKVAKEYPDLARKFAANLTGKTQRLAARAPAPQPNRTIEIMRKVELFGGLEDEHLEQLAALAIPVSVRAGDPVMNAGDPTAGFYLLLDGFAEVQNLQGGRIHILARIGPSGVIGEMEMIFRQPLRQATVMAINDVRLWYFPLSDYNRLISQVPEIGQKMRVTLGRIAASRTWSMH